MKDECRSERDKTNHAKHVSHLSVFHPSQPCSLNSLVSLFPSLPNRPNQIADPCPLFSPTRVDNHDAQGRPTTWCDFVPCLRVRVTFDRLDVFVGGCPVHGTTGTGRTSKPLVLSFYFIFFKPSVGHAVPYRAVPCRPPRSQKPQPTTNAR